MVTESQYARTCCQVLAKLYKYRVSEDVSECNVNSRHESVKSFSKTNNIHIKTNKKTNFTTLKNQQLPVIYQCSSGFFIYWQRFQTRRHYYKTHFLIIQKLFRWKNWPPDGGGMVIRFKIPSAKFNIAWFILEFLQHKKILTEVSFLSLVLRLMGLLSPLFKVLAHNALSTLDVLAVVLDVSGIAEVLTKGVREFLFSHTTNKIDVHLGMKVLRHTLGLGINKTHTNYIFTTGKF